MNPTVGIVTFEKSILAANSGDINTQNTDAAFADCMIIANSTAGISTMQYPSTTPRVVNYSVVANGSGSIGAAYVLSDIPAEISYAIE